MTGKDFSHAAGERGPSDRLDSLFETLAHRHRRHVLTVLADEAQSDSDRVELDELARGLADRTRFRIALHHQHLPVLERAGYIEWERDRNAIRRGERFGEVAVLVARLRAIECDPFDGWP